MTDGEAMSAFEALCRTEGIIPALESAHALAGAARLSNSWGDQGGDKVMVVSLSGRGDKDVATAAEWFNLLPPEDSTNAPDTGVEA